MPQVRETSAGPKVPYPVPDDRRLLLQEGIDVRPTPLDNLQAQGRTPTPEAGEPNVVRLEVDRRLAPPGREGHTALEDVPVVAPATPTGNVAATICAYPWPQGCEYWIGIAWCESTLGEDPNAYADWNPYVGLFQIWIGHNYKRGWLEDNANNILAAWELSHGGTYTGAWPNCQ